MKGDKNPFYGKHHSEETLEKLRKPKSEEHKQKLSQAMKGKTMSLEHRKIMSTVNAGRKLSEETKAKIAAARTGKKHTEETKKKISDSYTNEKLINAGNRMKGNSNPMHRTNIKNPELHRESLILSLNDIWYGGVKYPQDKRSVYCEKWTPDLRERIRAFWNYQSPISGKTSIENKGMALDCHHVYYQKKACCHWDEDARGYYAIVDGEKYYIKGDPNKFVPLTRDEHSRTKTNKLQWIKFFEDIIEENGGKCYFSEEEFSKLFKTDS